MSKYALLILLLHLFRAIAFTQAGIAPTNSSLNLKLERLSIEEGLSQSSVYSIGQDSKGFMWFGTTDGLNRYDGYQFKTYRFHPRVPKSLSNNRIYCVYEDRQGALWIGTGGGGLNRYNRAHENFNQFLITSDDNLSLSNNYITKIYEDQWGNLWIGTRGNGLFYIQQRNS
jgi:ligand-binding sensor domain-containing protein